MVREGDQAERRVRSGDEQVDGAVVHDLEDAFGAFVRERMVQRRGEVFEQHGYAEDDRGCEMRPSAVRHCGHDHDGDGGDGEQRADAVRDRVGDFLAQTVLTHRARRADGCSVAFASHVGILAQGRQPRGRAHSSQAFASESERSQSVVVLPSMPAAVRTDAQRTFEARWKGFAESVANWIF